MRGLEAGACALEARCEDLKQAAAGGEARAQAAAAEVLKANRIIEQLSVRCLVCLWFGQTRQACPVCIDLFLRSYERSVPRLGSGRGGCTWQTLAANTPTSRACLQSQGRAAPHGRCAPDESTAAQLLACLQSLALQPKATTCAMTYARLAPMSCNDFPGSMLRVSITPVVPAVACERHLAACARASKPHAWDAMHKEPRQLHWH